MITRKTIFTRKIAVSLKKLEKKDLQENTWSPEKKTWFTRNKQKKKNMIYQKQKKHDLPEKNDFKI